MSWQRDRDPVDPSKSAIELQRQIIQKCLDQRIVPLNGPIDDDHAKSILAMMLYLFDRDKTSPIQLVIDSNGGAVSSGLGAFGRVKKLEPCVRNGHGCRAIPGSLHPWGKRRIRIDNRAVPAILWDKAQRISQPSYSKASPGNQRPSRLT